MADKTVRPPLKILAADFIGATLAGAGFAEELAHTELVPESLRFAYYGWVMAAVGLLLMVPMLLWVVRRARAQALAAGRS